MIIGATIFVIGILVGIFIPKDEKIRQKIANIIPNKAIIVDMSEPLDNINL